MEWKVIKEFMKRKQVVWMVYLLFFTGLGMCYPILKSYWGLGVVSYWFWQNGYWIIAILIMFSIFESLGWIRGLYRSGLEEYKEWRNKHGS